MIELKEGRYEDQVAAVIREAELSKVLVVSFDADCHRRIAPLLPDAGIGYIFRSPGADLVRVAASIPASYTLPWFIGVTEGLIDTSRGASLKTFVWTPNSEEEFGEASTIGVHGIVTDDPSSARTFFGPFWNARDTEQAPLDL